MHEFSIESKKIVMEGSGRASKRGSRSLDTWEEDPPPDKGHVAYLTFFWLGAGFLFPWNAFITGIDYFASLYPESHIDYVFSVSYMLPNMLLLALLMMFGHHYSSRGRVLAGFVAFLCLLILIPVLDLLTIHNGRGSSLSLGVTVAAVALSGGIDSVIQGSLFGMAGGMPEHYTQALVGGSSASGVIICIARTVTKIVLPDTGAGLRISTAVYFAFSSVFLLLCVLGCQNLHKLPIMQFYERRKGQSESLLAVDRLPAGDDLKAPTLVGLADGSLQKVDMPPGPIKWLFSKFFTVEGHALALRRSEGADYWKVFLKVWPCATTLWLVYIVTLSIFPGFISEGIHSDRLGDWFPVLLMCTFNLGDFGGKMAPTALQTPSMPLIVAGCSTRLLLFPPLFALALFGPPILRTEVPVFLLTAALGFSNGIYTGWLMMIAPARVKVEEAEASGNIMVFALVSGLFCGSCVGWLWLIV